MINSQPKRPLVPLVHLVPIGVLIAGVGLAGCLAGLHKKDPAPLPPPRDQSAERDARQIEQMERARAKANQTGAAADATTFASVLGTLHHNKVDVRRNLPPTLVDEAATCLDSRAQGAARGSARAPGPQRRAVHRVRPQRRGLRGAA